MVESACNQLLGKSTEFMGPWIFTVCSKRVSSAHSDYLLALCCGIVCRTQLKVTLLMIRCPRFPFLFCFNVSLFALLLSMYRGINLSCWTDCEPLKNRPWFYFLLSAFKKKIWVWHFHWEPEMSSTLHQTHVGHVFLQNWKRRRRMSLTPNYPNTSMWLYLLS